MRERALGKEAAWEALFNRHDIVSRIKSDGYYSISASDINKFHEARLMTKFDHSIQLPEIFKRNGLTIQPDSRGTYVIGPFESYFSIPYDSDVDIEHLSFPEDIETIDPQKIYSESAAILCADLSGMINLVLSEEVRLTVFGRMSTGSFSYRIRNSATKTHQEINVNKSQCEIDAGFEGTTAFAIIEVKNESISDFMVRQLYYPYRKWCASISKPIIPILMTFSSDIFTFNVFRFNVLDDYNSLELIKQRKFRIVPHEIQIKDIINLLDKTKIENEPDLPFPQADSFPRVLDLLQKLYFNDSPLTRDYITENYAFDARQTQYYTSAAAYLGLVDRKRSGKTVSYELTAKGRNIMKLPSEKRQLALAACILSRTIFNRALHRYFQNSEEPTIRDIVNLMKEVKTTMSKESTYSRRSQTVLSWIRWILQLTKG